jgi:hypothetical protein
VDLDAATVDEQPVWHILAARQRAEDTFPYAAFGPADEPVVERLLRPIDIGTVGPAPAALQSMDDPAQHTTIVNTLPATHIRRQKRLDPSPLHIRKPEVICHFIAPHQRQ